MHTRVCRLAFGQKRSEKFAVRNQTNPCVAVRTTWKAWVGSVQRLRKVGFARASAAKLASRTHNALPPFLLAQRCSCELTLKKRSPGLQFVDLSGKGKVPSIPSVTGEFCFVGAPAAQQTIHNMIQVKPLDRCAIYVSAFHQIMATFLSCIHNAYHSFAMRLAVL